MGTEVTDLKSSPLTLEMEVLAEWAACLLKEGVPTQEAAPALLCEHLDCCH